MKGFRLRSIGFFKGYTPFLRYLYILISHFSTVILLVFFVLFLFTTLARLNIVSVFGGAIVYSGSMEPSIRRWDMVVWVRRDFGLEDVVVYCLNPSFCVVHRYVEPCPNGNADCLITKGDANPAPDPPISAKMVKGVALLRIPREVWLPIFGLAVAIAVASIARARVIGVSSAITYATLLIFIVFVYGFTQPTPTVANLKPPELYLSDAYLDRNTCRIVIKYVGTIAITGAEGYINGVKVPVEYNATYVILHPPPELLGELYKTYRYANVSVYASLNNMGRLTGVYRVILSGSPLEIKAVNGSLSIYNPNCFPMNVSIAFQYSYTVGDPWRYTTPISIALRGFESKAVEPPPEAGYVYADIVYIDRGVEVWRRIVVRYGWR